MTTYFDCSTSTDSAEAGYDERSVEAAPASEAPAAAAIRAGELARISQEQAAWARLMTAWSRTNVRQRRATRKAPAAPSG